VGSLRSIHASSAKATAAMSIGRMESGARIETLRSESVRRLDWHGALFAHCSLVALRHRLSPGLPLSRARGPCDGASPTVVPNRHRNNGTQRNSDDRAITGSPLLTERNILVYGILQIQPKCLTLRPSYSRQLDRARAQLLTPFQIILRRKRALRTRLEQPTFPR